MSFSVLPLGFTSVMCGVEFPICYCG